MVLVQTETLHHFYMRIKMIYAYYRVSTELQNYESQKVGVIDFANRMNWKIDKEYIDEGVSGTILAKERKLGALFNILNKDDVLITSELSRLGRSTSDVINTCQLLVKKGVNCYLVKQGMSIDNTPMGKMMIAILSAFAEMERDLISQRTIEGLKRRKADGVQLGRPVGSKNRKTKMSNQYDNVLKMLQSGMLRNQIAKELHVSFFTVNKYIKSTDLQNFI